MIDKHMFFNEIKDAFGLVIEIMTTQDKEEKIFTILEGKDNVYYYDKINKLNNESLDIINMHAGCKNNVLTVYNILKTQGLIKKHNLKLLFFVDKDFDDNSNINTRDIYITEGYSFENYYTNEKTFTDICKNNLYYFDDTILESYNKRKNEFHDLVEGINQFKIYSKNKKYNISFDTLKMSKILDITFEEVTSSCSDGIEKYLSDNYFGGKSIPKVVKKIKFSNKHYDFRGKDELYFFTKYINNVDAYIKDNNLRKSGYKKIGTNESPESFLDRFSKYSEFPLKLKDYINLKIS